MDNNNTPTISSIIISNIISIALMVFNIYVFLQLRDGDSSLLTISAILNLIDFFFISGGKGLIILIFLCIYNIVDTKSLWNGICLGLLFENIITYILGILLYIIIFICMIFKKDKTKSTNYISNEEIILLSMANDMAKHSGFNSYMEWKIALCNENNFKLNDLTFSNITEELSYISNLCGYSNFDDMFKFIMNS